MVATGSIKGSARKVAVVGCYIPPNYSVPQARQTLDFICGAVTDIKREMDDPFVVVTGDFNQWKIHEVLEDFPDLIEHGVGNTRSDHCIDRVFSNLDVQVAGTVPPLETDRCPESSPKKSDHRISFIQSLVNKVHAYKMLSYTYRYYSPEAEAEFGKWLTQMEWDDLLTVEGNIYQREMQGALGRYFPLVTVRRKSTDPPWYNQKIRKRLKQERGIYRREGRSPKWRKVRRLLEDLVERRRKNYCGSQKDALLARDGDRAFFKYIQNYKSYERQ